MTNLTRYNPLEELIRDFTKGFWIKPVGFPAESDLAMKIDIKEDEKTYTVKADIPGVRKEDIQIDIDEDTVSLRAEARMEKEEKKGEKVVFSDRSYGMVARSFTLPTAVDEKGAKAEYKDGVLNLMLPKKANGAAKRIAVS